MNLAFPQQLIKCLTLLLFALLLPAGCGRQTSPPGPNTIHGTVGGTSYSMLVWDEGLRILLWTDIVGGAGSAGSGSAEEGVYRQTGEFEAPDGRSFAYTLETADGVTANFAIEGTPYDLDQGALFLVSTRGGEVSVEQLDVDLGDILATNEGIERFGQEEPAVVSFIASTGGR